MKQFILLPFLLLLSTLGLGQVNIKDSCVTAELIEIDLGVGIPMADMSSRFGLHATAGGGFHHKTNQNWLFGVNGAFIYGSDVREDSILDKLRNDAGYIIGTDGLGYDPILWESGIHMQFEVGKITDIWSINPNSGLTFMGGLGFMQHRIWIYIDEVTVPQLAPEYRIGYDRLTNGLMASQYIGYYYFSSRNFVNFRGGIEILEGFTQNRRTVNFDTQLPDDTQRLDMMINLKVSWVLPIYKQPRTKFYTH